jgi:hypothetical protein
MTTPRLLLCSSLALSLIFACSRSSELDEGGALASVPGAPAAVDLDQLDQLDTPALTALALADAARDDADPELHTAIVERLREGGPAALDALIAEYRSVPDRPAAEDAAWRALIDEVAAQRDAHYGGLFWRRDMQAALAEAEASGKPVLSLRLLGDLGSEYSCANSRLFRTLLYADPELAAWLEANFVLHWSSERPVPKLAIDFGDGRVVERTITGNSAHFVLDANGRTIDVIPGLLAGPSFRAALEQSLGLHAELARTRTKRQWRAKLVEHHEAAFEAAVARLSAELGRVRGQPQNTEALAAWLASAPGSGEAVPALAAVPMAVGKAKIEKPILAAAPRAVGGEAGPGRSRDASLGPRDDFELARLGARVAPRVELHPNSVAIIAAERPLEGLVPAGEREAAMTELHRTLRVSIQQDTAKNALELHPRVHAELAARARDNRSLGFADVDEWVYARLFETPAEDRWLGLVDPAVYTGLEAGGLVATTK